MPRLLLALTLALTLALRSAAPAAAEDQAIALEPGFNFVGVLVETADTSRTLLDRVPEATQVFVFDAATQSFRFQLRLPGSDLYFGSPFPLEPLRGYVVKCGAAATVTVTATGTPDSLDPLPGVVAGFNLVPLPALSGTGARAFLAGNAAMKSIFRWDAETAAFTFILKLPTGTLFGEDFPLGPPATAYFLKCDPAAAVVASLSVTPGSSSAPAGGRTDLGDLLVVATFADGSSRDVTAEATWSIESGGGNLDGALYACPAEAGGDAILKATFSSGGATASGTFTLHIAYPQTIGLALSTAEVVVAPSSSLDLAEAVDAWLVYDNGATVEVTADWSVVVAAGGSLARGVFTAGPAPGDAVLRASKVVVADGFTFTADLAVTVH